MKISEYIVALQEIQEAEGDLEVVTHRPGQGASSIGLDFATLSAPRVGRTYTYMGSKAVDIDKRDAPGSAVETGKVVFIYG